MSAPLPVEALATGWVAQPWFVDPQLGLCVQSEDGTSFVLMPWPKDPTPLVVLSYARAAVCVNLLAGLTEAELACPDFPLAIALLRTIRLWREGIPVTFPTVEDEVW